MNIRFQNFIASLSLTGFTYLIYSYHPYFADAFQELFVFDVFGFHVSCSVFQVFDYVFPSYIFCFTLIYILESQPELSKSVLCVRGLDRLCSSPIMTFKQGMPQEEKIAILAVLVKMFYAPLMVFFLMGQITAFTVHFSMIMHHFHDYPNFITLFQQNLYWSLFQLIFFLDVFFFTLGYLIEHKSLGNNIISVEPTLLGWGVALVCYPPFNEVINNFLPWQSADFPKFVNPMIDITINLIILLLMFIYALASVALGFKASNLTHRGIVSRGPYRYLRHPAYTFKNFAWWLGTIPAFLIAWHKSVTAALCVIIFMGGWTLIYFLRALTEERHLQMVNGDYEEYMKKVPYRFIPGVV